LWKLKRVTVPICPALVTRTSTLAPFLSLALVSDLPTIFPSPSVLATFVLVRFDENLQPSYLLVHETVTVAPAGTFHAVSFATRV
jgi:hypothetical protein